MNRIELGKLSKPDGVLTAALDLRTIRILFVLTCRILTEYDDLYGQLRSLLNPSIIGKSFDYYKYLIKCLSSV